jgi:hypothetical protein
MGTAPDGTPTATPDSPTGQPHRGTGSGGAQTGTPDRGTAQPEGHPHGYHQGPAGEDGPVDHDSAPIDRSSTINVGRSASEGAGSGRLAHSDIATPNHSAIS